MYENNQNGFHGWGGPGEGRGGHGGRGGGDLLSELMGNNKNTHFIFVGSVNCLRHKPYMGIGQKMQEGKASILCPSLGDFSSGRYLAEVEEAVEELANEKGITDFIIACGCQWVILSTDGDLICEHLKEKGLNVTIKIDDHLEHGDHE